MAKHRKSKIPKHKSPLTATSEEDETTNEDVKADQKNDNKAHDHDNYTDVRHNEHPDERRPQKSQKRARREAQEDFEEQQLTNLIFGVSSDVNNNNVPHLRNRPNDCHGERIDTDGLQVSISKKKNVKNDFMVEPFSFQIDRTGKDDNGINDVETDDDGKNNNEKNNKNVMGIERTNKGNNLVDDDIDYEIKTEHDYAPAWEDDDGAEVNLTESSNRLKKLRKSRQETNALSSTELEQRLRERYQQLTHATARTDWAKKSMTTKGPQNKQDRAAATLFSTSSSLLASSSNRLPPNILSVVRCPDANLLDPNKAVVQAVHFHPSSDPDQPLMLTAGLDKTLRFFQVGEEKSQKIHGIHFPRLPIYNASFLGNTGNVVVSGRRSFFYIYDAVAGKIDLVPQIMGREEKSWEKHTVSPDGRLIAFVGNDGYVVLVDSHSKHWVADLKLNGSVRAVTFTPDGNNILASGSDGDIYRWDVNSRRCIERFSNNDGTITSSLAASSKVLAVGAESGVINLYSEYSPRNGHAKTPLKSIMNLHSSADTVRFNHDGQILAMSTKREQDGLKLLHVPSKTVFSNWPTSKTPLKYVWSMDFSPQSRFIAIGNDKGKCLLYKLDHYNKD